MKTAIDRKTLKYLAELGRIELSEKSEDKLLKDIKAIFDYFEELKEVDTEGVEPMAGGCAERGGIAELNVVRNDEIMVQNLSEKRDKLINAFPEKENDYLKTPAVFE